MQKIVSLIRTVSTLSFHLPNRSTSVPSFFNTLQNVNSNRLLVPHTPMLNSVCGFKVRRILNKRCKSCYFVFRDQRMYVMCPARPRHKQMAMKQKPHNTWILTHASQSPVRPW